MITAVICLDKILIKDLKLFAYHGVNPEEKRDGQNFILDITLYSDLSKPCLTDNVNDTVSYAKVIKTVRAVFTEKSFDLIEKAAQTVSDAILDSYPAIVKVKILLKKPEAPVKADFGFVAVEIERERKYE